jgi:hypothetical protein
MCSSTWTLLIGSVVARPAMEGERGWHKTKTDKVLGYLLLAKTNTEGHSKSTLSGTPALGTCCCSVGGNRMLLRQVPMNQPNLLTVRLLRWQGKTMLYLMPHVLR